MRSSGNPSYLAIARPSADQYNAEGAVMVGKLRGYSGTSGGALAGAILRLGRRGMFRMMTFVRTMNYPLRNDRVGNEQ
jgi:hypothetical protein